MQFCALPIHILQRIATFLPVPVLRSFEIERRTGNYPRKTEYITVLSFKYLSAFMRTCRHLYIINYHILHDLAAADIPVRAIEWTLHRAAAHGNLQALQEFISRRPKILEELCEIDDEESHSRYMRPIYHAAANNHIEAFDLLHNQGDDPFEVNTSSFGITAMTHAARNGHMEMVMHLLEVMGGYSPDWNTNSYAHTPLFWAACNGHMAVVEILLAAGADANSQTPNGENVLHWLAERRNKWGTNEKRPYADPSSHADICRLLVSHGADPTLCTQLDPAIEVYDSPLSLALKHGNIPILRAILDTPGLVDVNARVTDADHFGDRPLHILARYPPPQPITFREEWTYVGMFVVLISAGANVSSRNRKGYTPLLVAVQDLNPIAVRVLLENAADPDAATRKGKTALHVLIEGWSAVRMRASAESETMRVFQELVQVLEREVVDTPVGKYGTPLHVAVKAECLFMCEVLCRCGASPNTPDRRKVTPMMEALYLGNQKVVQILLDPWGVGVRDAKAETEKDGTDTVGTEL